MKKVTVLVTGGIGSGKSAVSACLERNGVPVYDSDSRTKALYDEDRRLCTALEELTGTGLRNADGKFDCKRFASMVFSDAGLLGKVESIVHPAVLDDFKRWREEALTRSMIVGMESAIALDKPLFRGVFDVVVMVDAPLRLRVERACARDGSELSAVMERIGRQNIDLSRADFVLKNDGSLSLLEADVSQVIEDIRRRWL